jgi:hypothetical protein
VRVSIDTKTGFLHFVYPAGEVKNTVEAVSRIHPRTSWAFGFAIASIGDGCGPKDGGAFFNGTADTVVIGGGVYSNSCLDKKGASGSLVVDACDPPGSSCGKPAVGISSLEEPGGHTEKMSPTPTWLKTGVPMPPFKAPEPDCAALDEKEVDSNPISSGIYDGFSLQNSDTLTMEPGLYCFDGDIKVTGGSLTGVGVTIVMRTGSITITGGDINLAASTDDEPANHALRGMLIYMPKPNSSGITMVGNGGSAYLGTVYAPDGQIEVGGTGGVNPTYNTQLVGKVVKVEGTAQIKVFFDQTYDFEQVPLAELSQ